jgi:dihydropteroate synthase
MYWQTSRFQIDLAQPQVMGIVNVTPDSFSDGGQHAVTAAALAHCEKLLRDGVHILDLGAESTRPGAQAVTAAQELERLLPVLRAATTLGVPISIDTYKPQVMHAALDAGADIINDIWGLRWMDSAAPQYSGPDVVAGHPNCGVCLMHMHREPRTMQVAPMQGDILDQVLLFLERSAQNLTALGVEKARITLDPGVGFGKTVEQNFSLLTRQSELLRLGYPLLVGWSRKSSLATMAAGGATLAAQERLVPSIAAALLAVERGARIVRVHDVAQTVQALKVWQMASPV